MVIRIRKLKKDRQYNGPKKKRQTLMYTKHYAENTNPTKKRR